MKELLVNSTEAADLLTTPNSRRLLAPFIASEVTLSEAAEQLGMKLNSLHYHVQKWLALNLVSITREVVQNSKRVKLYRATGEVFIVPLTLASSTNLETHFSSLCAESGANFGRWYARTLATLSDSWSFQLYLEPRHGVIQTLVASEGNENNAPTNSTAPPHYASDIELTLSDEKASELSGELSALYDKYFNLQQPKGKAYWLQLGLAPISY